MTLSAFDPGDVVTNVKPNGIVVRDFPNGIRTKTAPDGRTVATMAAEDGSTRVVGRPTIKRSRAVALVAMGLAGMLVTACDQPQETVHVFKGEDAIEQCIATATMSPEYCKQGYEAAMKLHEEVSPAYETLAQCETDHGEGFCGAKAASPVVTAAADKGPPRSQQEVCPPVVKNAEPGALSDQVGGPAAACQESSNSGGGTVVPHSGGGNFFTPYMLGYMMGQNNSTYTTPQPLYRHASTGHLVTPSKYVFPVAAPVKAGPISVPAHLSASSAAPVPGKLMIPNAGTAFTVKPSAVTPASRTVVGSVPSVRASSPSIGKVGHAFSGGVSA